MRRRAWWALACVAAVPTAAGAQGGARVEGGSVPQVAATARSEARLAPDRATVTFTIDSRAPTAKEATAENARLHRAVLDTIRALHVAGLEVETFGYQLFPQRQYYGGESGARSELVGYAVTNGVRVELTKLDQLGALVDAVMAKGGEVSSSIEFHAGITEETRRRLARDAVARARADAEALASALGGTLGALVEATTTVTPTPIPWRAPEPLRRGVEMPVVPANYRLVVTVTARWELRGVERR